MVEYHAQDSGRLLQFTGERSRPSELEEVAQRRPELGDQNRPAELENLASRQSMYLLSSSDDEPDVDVNRVESDGEGNLWRVDVRVEYTGTAPGVRGRTGLRREPDEYLNETQMDVDFRGYRPEWVDALPMPRVLPETIPPLMERIDGRRLVRPFQTTRFPPEERQVYRDASWPWGLVCKIFTNTGARGSAALVGPRLAVTAGHMIPPAGAWWIRVVPGYFDGTSLHGAGVQSFVSDWRGYSQGSVVGYDWAILRLYEPLGSWLGYFGHNSYDDDWEDRPYWTHLGYPGAINPERPSRQFSVSVFDDDSDSNGGQELETRADMGPGNSGGPMFGWWGGDPRLLGVVSGEEYDSAFPSGEWGNVVAGGSGFHNLINWGRTNWP